MKAQLQTIKLNVFSFLTQLRIALAKAVSSIPNDFNNSIIRLHTQKIFRFVH